MFYHVVLLALSCLWRPLIGRLMLESQGLSPRSVRELWEVTPNSDAWNYVTASFAQSKSRLIMTSDHAVLADASVDLTEDAHYQSSVEVLRALAADPANHVWINTGRSKNTLDEQFGDVPNINYGTELGMVLTVNKEGAVLPELPHIDLARKGLLDERLKALCINLFGWDFSEHALAKRDYSTIISYGQGVSEDEKEELLTEVRSILKDFSEYRLVDNPRQNIATIIHTDAKKVHLLEAVEKLIPELDCIVVIGHSKFDESLFLRKFSSQVENFFSMLVTNGKDKKTYAEYVVPQKQDAIQLLHTLGLYSSAGESRNSP